MEVPCKFASSGSGSRTCEKAAVKFVRAGKSGRLCPLCAPCLKSFEEAQSRLKQTAAERPGAEADLGYELVEVAAGAEQYAAQPAKAG